MAVGCEMMAMAGAKPFDITKTEVRALAEAHPVDAPAKAKKFHDRAEECRALAQMMTCAANATFYLHIAEIYDGLAEQEE